MRKKDKEHKKLRKYFRDISGHTVTIQEIINITPFEHKATVRRLMKMIMKDK